MTDIDNPHESILDAYRSAVFAGDVAALMRIYDASVRVFDAWGVWSYEDAAAWQGAVEGWFSSLGAERVRVSFDDVRSSTAGEMAFLSAIVRYASISEHGEELRAMRNRLTWVIRTTGGVARVVHEHTSAPIGLDDMKAILDR